MKNDTGHQNNEKPPSLEYRTFFYSFGQSVPNLTRGYLLFRTDLSTQFERIFETSDPDIPRVKHLIRPILTYNLIPLVTPADEVGGNPSHPFLQQIRYAQNNNFSGYNFDDRDIVPIDASRSYSNYFVPLGNSLSYGFTTQLLRRRGAQAVEMPSYQKSIELQVSQTYNFRDREEPYSQLSAALGVGYDKWGGTTNFTYTPYLPFDEIHRPYTVSSSVFYIIERSTKQGLFVYDRSFSLGYTYNTSGTNLTSNPSGTLVYSLSDYVVPSVSGTYEIPTHRMLSMNAHLGFQSPSRCWKLDLGIDRSVCQRPDQANGQGFCITPTIAFDFNLTGSSYGGVGAVSSAVTGAKQ